MSTRFVLFVIVMAVAALVSPAHGATEQGMVEFGGSVAFTTYVGEDSLDVWIYGISTHVAYFASDAFSVGGRLTFEGMTDDYSLLGLYFVADSHMDPTSTVVPFIGAAIGIVRLNVETWSVTFDDAEVAVEFHGGVKAFMRDNIAVTMEVRYKTYLEDFADFGELKLLAGISVFLF